ncbi:MAG: discoidin domain-containing protein [Gammaproteobacteria bacterium]
MIAIAGRARAWIIAAALLLTLIGIPIEAALAAMVDDFEQPGQWKATSAEGVELDIAQDKGHSGMAMRLDFDFHGRGGHAIARREVAMPLPANYQFTLQIRAEAPVNHLEFKLVDRSGLNVWWLKQRDLVLPTDWQKKVIKKRHIRFAWGPANGGEPADISAIEFAITAGSGGKGSIWIDDLAIEEREPQGDPPQVPVVRASTTAPGHEAEWVLDNDQATDWRSGAVAEDQWVLFDFGKPREYGGLVIDWDPQDHAVAYEVQISDDGEAWQRVYGVQEGNGGRDYVALPDGESRYLRLWLSQSSRDQGYGIKDIAIQPYDFSLSPNHFFAAVAADADRGSYPKYLGGQQSYWTVTGVPADEKEALVNEEGMVEVDRKGFSIEPFLYEGGKLVTWNDVELHQELEGEYLPIPSVGWNYGGLKLQATALAAGKAGASSLHLRYALHNDSQVERHGSLFLALRPFQVLPPWQDLNLEGGVSRIGSLAYDGGTVSVNNDRAVFPLVKPERFGAASFAQGALTEYLKTGALPGKTSVTDELGYASGALEYRFELRPGTGTEVYLAVPFHRDSPALPVNLPEGDAHTLWEGTRAAVRAEWEAILNRAEFRLPEAARKITDSLRSTLAYILINQDGPRIQPGSRTYERAWIRDGALISAALLRMGHAGEARDFIRWYAGYQFGDGRVPCCVDRSGADSVAENDSNGEWIYLIMEYYRYTRDVGLVIEMWPHVVKAVDYIEYLRSQRITEPYRTDEKRAYYGLVPESISHEGYSARPVHSYWDNFFVLRGLKDAASLAAILGEDTYAKAIGASRDAFRDHLYASIDESMALHKIDYIPGAVELGDFDVASTSISIDPLGDLRELPEPALLRTFDRYYEFFHERKNGGAWENYTPYEWRIVGALLRMGQKERAHQLLNFFMEGQRPAAWNQWAEVVWRDRDAPRFIGDMPHTWVGGEYIRSVRDLFVFERESDQALVIGAGLTDEWVASDEGVEVRRLPTYYGTLNYAARMQAPDEIGIRMSGDVVVPPGKIVIRSPLPTAIKGVTVNGKAIETFAPDEAVIGEFPADVVLRY